MLDIFVNTWGNYNENGADGGECTIVLITHDNDVAKQAERAIHILDGQITEVAL